MSQPTWFKDLAESQQQNIQKLLLKELRYDIVLSIVAGRYKQSAPDTKGRRFDLKDIVLQILSANLIYVNEHGLHNLEGPAVNIPSLRIWCTFGKLHNPDGPAIEANIIGRRHIDPDWNTFRWSLRKKCFHLHGYFLLHEYFQKSITQKSPAAKASWLISCLLKLKTPSVRSRYLTKIIAHVKLTLSQEGMSDDQINTILSMAQLL